MFRRFMICFIALVAVMVPLQVATAQEQPVQPITEPVQPVEPAAPQVITDKVVAILFYSPTCRYCHIVINDHLPAIQAQFGDQLEVLMVNVQIQSGAMVYEQACAVLDPNGSQCRGVPLMAIGNRLLMGALEIPEQMPALVSALLTRGGLSLPEFPSMESLYSSWVNSGGRSTAISLFATTPTVLDRLTADPAGNAAAIVVLVALIVSLGAVVRLGMQGRLESLPSLNRVHLTLAVGGVLLAGSIAVNALQSEPFATFSAVGVFLLMLLTLVVMPRSDLRQRFGVPLVTIIGAGVAVYLAYIETSSAEAACGLIGNCTAVQESEYATVLGIPVGILGVVGYVLMLVTWVAARFGNPERRQTLMTVLLALVVGGVIFSIYLTFLEPFVIGATCAWCLMSALTMLMLLWLVAPENAPLFQSKAKNAPTRAAGRTRPHRA